ncbi:MAG: clan AA aspartic protease [Candidatus Eremiobacteraeota bacterium]|nr:clan AA aspartic protease [Candidatus Eremiobacteraeota bacterium]
MRRTIWAALTLAFLSWSAALASTADGDRALAAGQFDAAAAAYQTAAAANASDTAAWIGAATIATYNNDLAAASQALAHVGASSDARVARLQRIVAARTQGRAAASVPQNGTSIPFLQTDPLPVVAGQIDGKPVRLIVDTGAPTLALDGRFAEKLGLEIRNGGSGIFAGGKRAAVSESTVGRFTLGDASLRALPVVVMNLPASIALQNIDGILGTGVLYPFISTLDYAGGKLVLQPAAASAAVESAAAARGAHAEQMWLVGSHFIFARAHVNNGPEALFNIDTGGGGLGIQATKSTLSAAGITVDPSRAQAFQGGAGPATAIPFSADATLDGYTARNIPGLYFPNGDQFGIFPFAVGGVLSHEFFRQTRVTFDFTAMRIIVG